jgi:hypothetical protein
MGAAKCGTYGGYQAHYSRGEKACEACLAANRAYHRELRQRPHVREVDRWANRTRNRALQRLAMEYPERMAELVADERRMERDPRLAASASVACEAAGDAGFAGVEVAALPG